MCIRDSSPKKPTQGALSALESLSADSSAASKALHVFRLCLPLDLPTVGAAGAAVSAAALSPRPPMDVQVGAPDGVRAGAAFVLLLSRPDPASTARLFLPLEALDNAAAGVLAGVVAAVAVVDSGASEGDTSPPASTHAFCTSWHCVVDDLW